MKINFVMVPSMKISGGPLAILEYAERLMRRGHEVSITTYPPFTWGGRKSPFEWFPFSGKIYYDGKPCESGRVRGRWDFAKRLLRSGPAVVRNLRSMSALSHLASHAHRTLFREKARSVINTLATHTGLQSVLDYFTSLSNQPENAIPLLPFYQEATMAQYLMNAMPDCDVNIATLWSTAIPVYFSNKGRPVIFMQHYEEVFYPPEREQLTSRLLTRFALSLPIYKIANSSWLAAQFERRFGQKIPFSNNALVIEDFAPRLKKSEQDGILRVVTYTRPAEWKGFQDAVAAMRLVLARYGKKVEWHVFGYLEPAFPPDNEFAPYHYHPDLSFAELARLYAESDVTLCPSWYESFPLPPLESMASGTAVVTTEYGTEDYAFHEKNALVVKSRDTAGMAQAVSRLLDDADLRQKLAKAGRAKAEEYSWDHAVDVREQMLQDICDGNLDYDLFATVRTGLVDEEHIPFEQSPADLQRIDGKKLLRIDSGQLFLLQNGCKRCIVNPTTLGHKSFQGIETLEVDRLTGYRIPTGAPIRGTCDL
jgi:glycosyltransferase involved in cell wall biosynthesis